MAGMRASIRTAACAISAMAWLAACAGGPAVHETRHPDRSVARSATLVDGAQDGAFESFFQNGVRSAAGSYRNDARDGEWTHWHENGALRMRGRYEGERQVAPWEFRHPNGALQCRGEYVGGREHGPWLHCHDNGAIAHRGCFVDGQRALLWESFDVAGKPTSRGSYWRDLPVGEWTRWDASGAASRCVYPLPDGVELQQERWPDGGLRREGAARDGVRQGAWVTRHRNGVVRAFVPFVDGAPHGEATFQGDDGELLARGRLERGRAVGAWRARSGDALVAQPAPDGPRAPWDRQWSDAASVAGQHALDVALRWLDEAASPLESAAVALAPQPTPAPRPVAPPREEAPTEPGDWTERELAELALYIDYYATGRLPRRSGAASRYGSSATARTLGAGDAKKADTALGKPLPCARLPLAGGGELELATLRGQRVVFVVMRGFGSQVCIYCHAQAVALAQQALRAREIGCALVVVFPGTRSRMKAFQQAWARDMGDKEPPFQLAYDPDGEAVRALGLAVAGGKDATLARPASYVLDRQGIVRFSYVAESDRNAADRAWAEKLLRVAAELE